MKARLAHTINSALRLVVLFVAVIAIPLLTGMLAASSGQNAPALTDFQVDRRHRYTDSPTEALSFVISEKPEADLLGRYGGCLLVLTVA